MKSLTLFAAVGCLVVSGCSKSTVEEISLDSSGPIEPIPEANFAADDWPWWRGPNRNGIANEQTVPTSWSEDEKIVWKTAVPGRGHSSPTVIGNRIFLATADEDQETQSVLCFDRTNGEQIWSQEINRGSLPRLGHQNQTHATCTLAADGERVFVAFLNHGKITATALNLDGDEIWSVELGPYKPKFGYAPSPTIYKEFVIFAADHGDGGYLAAVHRKNGTIHWRNKRPAAATYASPIVATVAGQDQLLISGANRVDSYDPSNGELRWTAEGTAESTCGTIVWDDDIVFASGGHPEHQTLAVKADGSAEIVWSNKYECYEQSLLAHDGYVYAVDEQSVAYCWEAASGEIQWRNRLRAKFSASPILVGNLIFASNEQGRTYVFKANPEEFELVAENQLGDEAFATPTICGGRIYARVADSSSGDRQEYLYCIGQ